MAPQKKQTLSWQQPWPELDLKHIWLELISLFFEPWSRSPMTRCASFEMLLDWDICKLSRTIIAILKFSLLDEPNLTKFRGETSDAALKCESISKIVVSSGVHWKIVKNGKQVWNETKLRPKDLSSSFNCSYQCKVIIYILCITTKHNIFSFQTFGCSTWISNSWWTHCSGNIIELWSTCIFRTFYSFN